MIQSNTIQNSMIQISNLHASYGKTPVLQGVSLAVKAGEIAAIIGPNGCGKSTLLRCITGLMKPDSGDVWLQGKKIESYQMREKARLLAVLPQKFDGGEELTTQEMVMIGRTPFLSSYGAPSTSDNEIVTRVMAQTNTEIFRGRKVGELSGGERQRVLLARALAQQPQILLLDEPTSNLDIRYQFEILDLVFQLSRHQNLAVVLVLHQINRAAAVADTILLLDSSGQTRASGAPVDVMTSQNLEAVYGVPLRVSLHPKSGRPQAQSDWSFGEVGAPRVI